MYKTAMISACLISDEKMTNDGDEPNEQSGVQEIHKRNVPTNQNEKKIDCFVRGTDI
jgi:hypothetical protein